MGLALAPRMLTPRPAASAFRLVVTAAARVAEAAAAEQELAAGAEARLTAPRQRISLLDFCRRRSPGWQEGPHHPMLCETMQACIEAAAAGIGRRQMIFAPPQHGKSTIVSVNGPAWGLGSFPQLKVLLASYGKDLAGHHSANSRDLLAACGEEEFGVRIRAELRAGAHWGLVGGGSMLAGGVGGPFTGMGGSLLIGDDLIKDHRAAKSPVIRQAAWDWWRTVFMTRVAAGAAVLLMMTRWHEDDIAGRLLAEEGRAEEGGTWHVLSLPGRSLGDGDPLERPKGRALWAGRGFDERFLASQERTLGPYFFEAMYQQSPQPDSGAFFRRSWFKYFREIQGPDGEPVYLLSEGPKAEDVVRVKRSDCWALISVDTALKETEAADYYAEGRWLITPPINGRRRRLLDDVVREKLEVPDQLPQLKLGVARARPLLRFVGIEDSVAGLALFQQAQREKAFPRVVGFHADIDKQARAAPLAGAYVAGEIYHRADAPWLSAFEDEMLKFPRAAHDDQVDMAAHAERALTEWDLLAPDEPGDAWGAHNEEFTEQEDYDGSA